MKIPQPEVSRLRLRGKNHLEVGARKKGIGIFNQAVQFLNTDGKGLTRIDTDSELRMNTNQMNSEISDHLRKRSASVMLPLG